MGSTLLELVNDAATELGLQPTQYVIRAADNTSRQLGALANRAGMMMLRSDDWTFLNREFHITVPAPVTATGTLTQGSVVITGLSGPFVASLLPGQMIVSGHGIMTSVRLVATNQTNGTATIDQPATAGGPQPLTFSQDTFPLPDDFLREINRTQWDRSMRWELRGPQSPQADQWVRSGIVATGPRRMWREVNNAIRIWPPPSATDNGSQLITEYTTKNWVQSAAGQGQPRFLADADTCAFDDDLMIMGLKTLFFQMKGFEYTKLQDDWYRAVKVAQGADGASPTLDMTRSRFPVFLSPANVQDADFPGSFGNP